MQENEKKFNEDIEQNKLEEIALNEEYNEEIDNESDFDEDDEDEENEYLDEEEDSTDLEEESEEDEEIDEDIMQELSELVDSDAKIDYCILELPASLKHLVDGYVDYAKEVVIDRALPGIDGLKPSQRRILYTMKFIEKVNDLSKCANIAGATMKLHPHGDQSIYDTMVRMTNSSLHLNVPYIFGKGSFGKVFSSNAKPAASRYTECKLEKITDELFKGMSGVDKISSYNDEYEEPILLPVSFPSILCNPTQGIAVGLASNIPAFNFHEVIKATQELIRTGDIQETLKPDFTTGGYYINNEKELHRLMNTGSAKIKLRGKWHFEGKYIVIDEIPYYTTVEEIMKAVKDLPNVVDTKDLSDRKGLKLTIECASKKIVQETLQDILRVSPLQMTMTTNVVVIVDNQPREIGLKEVLKEWVKFREKVVEAEIKQNIKDIIKEIAYYDLLVDLMTTEEKREPFMQKLLKEGKQVAKDFLGELYPTADEEIFDFILNKSIGSLGGIGNKQKNYLIELRDKKVEVEESLNHIGDLIVNELEEVNKRYKFPRKTEITDTDYVFEEVKGKKKAEAYPVIVVLDGKFIKKLKNTPTNQKLQGTIKCMSDDMISILDNKGRLLRVQVEQLDTVTEREKGIYLPLYLQDEVEDFEIITYEIVKDKKMGYMYNDGYAAVIDYNEWYSAKRKTKVTADGLAPDYIDKYLGLFRMDREYLMLRTAKGKLAVLTTDFMQKSRRARTKLIHVGKGDKIVGVCSASQADLERCILESDKFKGHFRVVSKKDAFNEEVYARLVEKTTGLVEDK